MKKDRLTKNIHVLLVMSACFVLVISVSLLMNHVRTLLDSDVRVNLAEIVTQNKDVITSKLQLEMNNLELVADQLVERISKAQATDHSSLKFVFMDYFKEKHDDRLFLTDTDGIAIMPDGSEIDVSGRKYFRLAIKGTQNISDRTISRKNGEEIFIISVPLTYKGKVVGVVQKQYTPEEMYQISSISLFSDQGAMYIINSQGYILITSDNRGAYSRELDNFYRLNYQDNPQAVNQLIEDIENNRVGFMETTVDGEKLFSAYTPIDQIYDWYLITSIATEAISHNAGIVIRLFYIILIVVVVFFTMCILYFFYYKNKQQANLERIAFVDTVTGGDTYTKFAMDMQSILGENPTAQFYLLAFDIDNFKYINSYYGFAFGDEILRMLNNHFLERLGANERIARVYSDHFVVLMADAAEERLNSLFGSSIQLDGVSVYLSAGLYPILNLKEAVNLMADKANMAAQKVKGLRYQPVAVYSDDFDRQMIKNEQMKRAVEQALADDEFIPFFQPKVDVRTGALVGAEALARWLNKDGKLVQPGDFISVCEQTGQIVAVDMMIYEKTLAFIRRNMDAGVACVPISVNFSRLHLNDNDFLNILFAKQEQYGVPPRLVELELTETVIFDNYKTIRDFMDKLHAYGFQISMDDFGSGYSSLHMLKDVDIDILKLDRGFLQDSASSERQRAVFSAICQMADRLNIKVVVEGVETKENVDLMMEFGCNIAQGFYYSKPIAGESFEKMYQEGRLN